MGCQGPITDISVRLSVFNPATQLVKEKIFKRFPKEFRTLLNPPSLCQEIHDSYIVEIEFGCTQSAAFWALGIGC